MAKEFKRGDRIVEQRSGAGRIGSVLFAFPSGEGHPENKPWAKVSLNEGAEGGVSFTCLTYDEMEHL